MNSFNKYNSSGNLKQDSGTTSLIKACRNDNIELVKSLIKNSYLEELICLADNEDYDSLTYFTQYSKYDFTKYEALYNFKATILWHSCRSFSFNLTKLLLVNGANVNANLETYLNSTPLMVSCSKNRLYLAKYLIERWNADVNIIDKNGETCLFYAVRNNEDCYDLVKYLIKKNINVSQINLIGKTAFDYTIQLKDTRVIELLINHVVGHNINKIDYNKALIDIAVRGEGVKFHLVYNCVIEKLIKIDALEIIGVVIGEKAINLPSSIMYWELSLNERLKYSGGKNQPIQTAVYFRNELKSKHELDIIANGSIEFQMHSLRIRERVLNKYQDIRVLSEFNVFKLLHFDNSNGKSKNFKQYLIKNYYKLSSLWLYGIGLQIKHLKPFHNCILENLFDFITYLKYVSYDIFKNELYLKNYTNHVLVSLLKIFLFEIKRSLRLIKILNRNSSRSCNESLFVYSSLNNLIDVLDKIDYDNIFELNKLEIDNKVSDNEENFYEKFSLKTNLKNDDDDDYVCELEYINTNLNRALRVLVYLIEFSICNNDSKLEHNCYIKSLIKNFVYLSKYMSSNSIKLFSLALSKSLLDNLNLVNKFKYDLKPNSSINFKFIRYLLSLGCDPDCLLDDYSFRNTFLNTGLFRHFSRKRYDCDSFIKLFLSHGAHLDYTNDEGLSLVDIYKAKFDLNLNHLIRTTSFVSLKCLSARAILKHNLPYMNELPSDLIKFLCRH